MSTQNPLLRASAQSGYNPLTVGFVLEGDLARIDYMKVWHFGNETTGPINDYVYNYTFFQLGSYNVWIEVFEKGSPVSLGTSNTITIVVTEGPSELKLMQTKAVLYQGDTIGFSVSTNVPVADPNYPPQWVFGDEQIPNATNDPSINHDLLSLNPTHLYNYTGTFVGKLVITYFDKSGNKQQPSWPFAVLVLASSLREITGEIECHSLSCVPPSEICFLVKTSDEVTFISNASGGTSGIQETWEFGDGNSDTGPIVKHRYSSKGVYVIQDTVSGITDTPTGSTNCVLTLHKNIEVRDQL